MVKNTDDFSDAMHDVKPLKKEKRVSLYDRTLDKATLAARRQSAETTPISDATIDPLDNQIIEQLEPQSILAFQRPGVQHGVYKQLRLGRYTIEARLDLHRMKVEQARVSVYQFVRDCMSHDVRCALITHGKGEGRETPALLKSYVAHWLPQIPEVLAFHTAQKHHGGTGATYLLLKKSSKKRLENLERHQRR